MLRSLSDKLKKLFPAPDNRVWSFDEAEDSLSAEELWCDPPRYAFLDIKLRGMLGLELAKHIKERSPATRILFCTAYSDYGVEAFGVQAVGYLLKPITEQKLRDAVAQVEEMFHCAEEKPETERLRVQTFGNFEVFLGNRPLVWERSSAKELFAFLIDRQGASVNNREIALALWEDDSKVRNVQTVISSLRKTLSNVGMADVLLRGHNSTSIDKKKVDCDLYRYLVGDIRAVNAYQGEYMTNYSWSEFTNGWLYDNHPAVSEQAKENSGGVQQHEDVHLQNRRQKRMEQGERTMTNRELRRLSRRELLELLIEQGKKVNDLQARLDEATEKLASRQIQLEQAGSIAEAALRLNHIFEDAQAAADQYLENIRARARSEE